MLTLVVRVSICWGKSQPYESSSFFNQTYTAMLIVNKVYNGLFLDKIEQFQTCLNFITL